ncbi:MAG: DNA repair protein RecO [Symbiobacteriaceae bacterium]|nr:DNA repair protein RecO [Symbiobacteriaceae bacterium]
MPYYNTQAIVLTSTNYGEADRILTLLTYERGRVRVIARGARRPRNRFTAMAQPLNHIDVQLAGSGNLETLNQGQMINSYRSLKEDLNRLACASYLLELFDKATEGASDVAEVYIMLLTALELLQYCEVHSLVCMATEMKLLAAIGFRPQLEYCIYCQEMLDNKKPLHYNIAEGGFTCDHCASPSQGIYCNTFSRHLLLDLQKVHLAKLDSLLGTIRSAIVENEDFAFNNTGTISRSGEVSYLESLLREKTVPISEAQEGIMQADKVIRESLRVHLGDLPKSSEFMDRVVTSPANQLLGNQTKI